MPLPHLDTIQVKHRAVVDDGRRRHNKHPADFGELQGGGGGEVGLRVCECVVVVVGGKGCVGVGVGENDTSAGEWHIIAHGPRG